jgi:DNA replication protein DnaC
MLDPKILNRATARFEQLKSERELNLRRAQERVYFELPRVKELDARLRDSILQIASASIQHSENLNYTLAKIRDANLEMQQERAELLASKGYAAADLDEVPYCPKCNDRGWVNGKACDCLMAIYIEEQNRELSKLLNIGNQSFETFNLAYYPPNSRKAMENVLFYCRHYAEKFSILSENLYLCGNPGLGKTFISASIAKVVAGHGFSVVYETAINLCATMEKLKFSRDDNQELEDDAHRYLNCDLLILDDLGTEMHTSFTLSAIYDVINSRLVSKLPMIINSNLLPAEIERDYTPQIASRITGEFLMLKFFGDDIRKLKD